MKDNDMTTQPTLPAEVREALHDVLVSYYSEPLVADEFEMLNDLCAALAPLWPQSTPQLAEELRQKCSKLTAEERASLMEFFWKEYGNTPPDDAAVAEAVERLHKFEEFGYPHAPIKSDLRTVLAALEQAQREVSDCRQILHSNSVEMEDMGRILGKEKDRAEAAEKELAEARDAHAGDLRLLLDTQEQVVTCADERDTLRAEVESFANTPVFAMAERDAEQEKTIADLRAQLTAIERICRHKDTQIAAAQAAKTRAEEIELKAAQAEVERLTYERECFEAQMGTDTATPAEAVAQLRAELDANHSALGESIRTIQRLRDELAAAQEDSKRLDWLDLHISTQETSEILGLDYSKCHLIRAAIDAAREGGAK